MFVYADNAATTSVSKTALNAMLPFLTEQYGNPSSLYSFGQNAAEALQAARETIAKCLNAEPREIYFTSCGSEADNQAIVSAARLGARKGKKHLISTKFEHHAVLHTLNKLEKEGFEVTLLDVHKDGVVRLEDLEAAIREDTALVTVMFANNEIGTVQPIAEIGALCREKKIPFHCDAVQAAGHMPIDVKAMNIDMLAISGHKFHAPKGVGALYARKGMVLTNIIEGGAQERGTRAGDGQHVGVHGLHVHGPVARCLHRVAVEGDLLLPAERADLRDGLHGADLVVGKHDGDQRRILPDGGLQVLQTDHPVLVHVQQRHLKALFFQLVQGVQHGVVLEFGGDQVLFALPRAQAGGGDDGLVVGLRAAGGEIDLFGLGVEAFGDGLPGSLQGLGGVLAEGVEAGGVAVLLRQEGQHGVQRGLGHAGGSGVVGVDKHFNLPFLISSPA